jgi:hypothetical protein
MGVCVGSENKSGICSLKRASDLAWLQFSVCCTASLPHVFPFRVINYTEQNLLVGYSVQCKRKNP